MADELKLIDLLGENRAARRSKKRIVQICGHDFLLQEWPIKYHALWMERYEESGLEDEYNRLQDRETAHLANMANAVREDPEVKDYNDRLIALETRRSELMAVYATDDEPDDIDAQVQQNTERMIKLRARLDEVAKRKEDEAFQKIDDLRDSLKHLLEKQNDLRLEFAVDVAALQGVSAEYEDWRAIATPQDFKQLVRWIEAGNAPWLQLQRERLATAPQPSPTGKRTSASSSPADSASATSES